MCTFAHRLIAPVLGAALLSCSGGDLTLPNNTAPGSTPAELAAYSGDGQEGTVGDRLPRPLVVLVTDANSQPVAGVPVVFGFESDVPGAEVYPAEGATDTAGHAEAVVRLGAITGTHIVEAQLTGATGGTLRATFEVRAVAEEKGKKGKSGDGDGDDDDD